MGTPRHSRLWIRIPWPLLLLLLLFSLGMLYLNHQSRKRHAFLVAETDRVEAMAQSAMWTHVLSRAVDGDTFEADGGLFTVRLAGVDTPETWGRVNGQWQRLADPDPRGVAAWKYMQGLEGRRVVLDVQARDSYGRVVARAKLWPDGPDIGEEIKRQGWGE